MIIVNGEKSIYNKEVCYCDNVDDPLPCKDGLL